MIIALLRRTNWGSLRHDLIHSAALDLDARSGIFVSRYKKIKTVEGVITEFQKFLHNINDALQHLPEETRHRSDIINELKRLRLAVTRAIPGIEAAKIDSNDTIDDLTELFTIIKYIPLEKRERKKYREYSRRRKTNDPVLSTDQELFASAAYDSVFEGRFYQ